MSKKYSEYKKGIKAAKRRIKEIGEISNTLISKISESEWKDWDKRNEDALVADKDDAANMDAFAWSKTFTFYGFMPDGVKSEKDAPFETAEVVFHGIAKRRDALYYFPFMDKFWICQGMVDTMSMNGRSLNQRAKDFIDMCNVKMVQVMRIYRAFTGRRIMKFMGFDAMDDRSWQSIYIEYSKEFIDFCKENNTDYFDDLEDAMNAVVSYVKLISSTTWKPYEVNK